MSAFSVLPLSSASLTPSSSRHLAGVGGRSTASVRTRYRRQTAALMLGTTVVGLLMALAAPSVSPVTSVTPQAMVASVNSASGSANDLLAPARRNRQFTGNGPRGRDGFGGRRP